MKFTKIGYIALMLIGLNHTLIAGQQDEQLVLNVKRDQVIHDYIRDLENADYQHITALFEEEGIVVSTSRGHIDAKEFFYGFLPLIESASIQYHQGLISRDDTNRYAVRFHFNFNLKDGEIGDGEYVDEFVFSDQSPLLKAVYMFENTKFKK